MRILKVSLFNLNSLKGAHAVDFDAEPLASAGLFAITGATGAGKSTLLDAITLALFGKAARYGNASNPEDVMSRGTGECRAEVHFDVKGIVYVAKWSIARARGKVDAKMQQPKRSVSDLQGNLLADSVSSSGEKVQELLGLDYERFMRSVMLAQGQFSRFLSSKSSDRAALLESLTGTEIYSRLGQLAYDEANSREAGIKDRITRIDTIVLLTEEQRALRNGDIAKAEGEQTDVKSKLDAITLVRGKVATLVQAQTDIQTLIGQLGLLADEQKQNLQDISRLGLHRKAEPFADVIRRHEAASQDLAGKSNAHKTAKQSYEQSAEDLGKRIAEFYKALADVAKSQQDLVGTSDSAKKVAEAQVVRLQKWLSDHEQDASLASKVGPLASAIKERDSTSAALDDVWSDWTERAVEIDDKAAKALPEAPAEIPEAKLDKSLHAYFSIVEPINTKLKEDLEAAREEIILKKEHHQKTLLLQSYEEQRGQLREGDPCALCGSKHHPYAKEAHNFSTATQLEKELKKAERAYELQKETVNDAATGLKQLVKDADKVRKAHAECLKAESRLADQFKKAGLKVEDKADVDSLQERANAYTEKEKELTKNKGEAKKHEDTGKEAELAIANIVKRQERLAKVPVGVQFVPVSKGQIDLGLAEKSYDEAFEEFRADDAELTAVAKNLKSAEAEMAAAETQIVAAASEAGFRSANELKDARMDVREVDRIEKAKKHIEDQIVAAKAKLEATELTRSTLIKEGVPQGDKAANIHQDYEELFAKNNELTTLIANNRSELRNDDQNTKDRERLLKEIGYEGKVVETWRLLRELVGSADGSKFRKFAQSITLELLIRHANRHMLKLSDRYKILRELPSVDSKGQKSEDELGLIVEDYDQANARRPMASLSGGESFLASLALALGLSDLAGRTVRIETLFIDEGFGTLDHDTLDVALTALEGLREGNKSVGIISHVEALKERITTQIVVTKVSSGHSTLSVIS